MTYRRGRAFRVPLLAAAGAAAIVAIWAPSLDAPGPPDVLIEPQTGMVLVALEPGSFEMGSQPSEAGRGNDETPRRVTLTSRIYMGRHEVTQTEWAVIMRDNPSHFAGCGRCPVENVDLFQVGDFIAGLNAQSTAVRYRLPTEAEWEYACRAGSAAPFSSGPQLTIRDANIDSRYPMPGGSAAAPFERTVPVGGFPPNAWGLHDMHGNVWEWTNDRYGPYDPADLVNPRGAHGGTLQVIRGGSWHFDAASARCSTRYTHAPQDKGYSLGFRVVAEPSSRRSLDLEHYRNR